MADIVPIGLTLDEGDVFTLWAPRWRDSGDEWEAFLGKDEDLFGFDSVADLIAFVRTDTDNDLADHPAWEKAATGTAHALDPDDGHRFDLITVYELLADKPTEESVTKLAGTLRVVSSIGSVCELAAITKFFNGNPVLASVSGGIDNFADKPGLKRWDEIGAVVGKGWDNVLDAVVDIISKPDVDADATAQAEEELAEEPEEDEDVDDIEDDVEDDVDEDVDEEAETDAADEEEDAQEDEEEQAPPDDVVLGADEDFWTKVGIDPIRMITSSGTFYSLRCYLDDEPLFLGRNGRVSVFTSERALARYLADEHDHDLSGLPTYDDIRTAATDGSLRVTVTDDNVYVLTGLADDFTDGPDEVDREQLELAVELLRDIGDYSEDATVDTALESDTALGKLVAHVLDPGDVRKPRGPYAKAVAEWTALESFVDSRLRQE